MKIDDDEKRIITAQLGGKDLQHISDMGKGTQTDNLRAVIENSRRYSIKRSEKIAEILVELEEWGITAEDLGLAVKSGGDSGLLTQLRIYKHILKRKGKAALIDAVKADIARNGLENKEVQNLQNGNIDASTN